MRQLLALIKRIIFIVGRVVNTRDVIVLDGTTVDELEQSFHNEIAEYLEDCQVMGNFTSSYHPKPF